jgi:hypothetical protein
VAEPAYPGIIREQVGLEEHQHALLPGRSPDHDDALASIILAITPPLEFATVVRTGLSPDCWAVICCRLLRPDEVGDQELHHAKGGPGGERGRPDLGGGLAPGHRPDEPEGHQHGEEGQLAPSMKAPKQNATSRTWMRRPAAIPVIESLITSNWPVLTVVSWTNIAINTIQPIGNKPNSAPLATVAVAVRPGIRYTTSATSKAVASPASA